MAEICMGTLAAIADTANQAFAIAKALNESPAGEAFNWELDQPTGRYKADMQGQFTALRALILKISSTVPAAGLLKTLDGEVAALVATYPNCT